MIRIGSLFSGIGGFELGLEAALPKAETIWQVENDPFCQSILKKNWPKAELFSDIRLVSHANLKPVDIVCGGFPCQDISKNGKGEGLNGDRSSLWFEMLRIVCELRPRIAIMENVPTITKRGLSRILGGLSEIGYDAEWRIISGQDIGAPTMRKRWFCVSFPSCFRMEAKWTDRQQKLRTHEEKKISLRSDSRILRHKWEIEPPIRGVVARIPDRLDSINKLRSLGNAIIPQCSRYVGEKILQSGLLDDLL